MTDLKTGLEKAKDFDEWLEAGVDKLSADFNKLVPKEIAYQYIDRLRKEGWLETVWDRMEALRAFRLYFIIYQHDDIMVKVQSATLLAKTQKEMNEIFRHVYRDFSKCTMELHKTLSDVLEKAGLSKVANKGLASPFSSIYEAFISKVRSDDDVDNSVLEFEMKLTAAKRKNHELNPNQGSVFDKSGGDLSDVEYQELLETAETAE